MALGYINFIISSCILIESEDFWPSENDIRRSLVSGPDQHGGHHQTAVGQLILTKNQRHPHTSVSTTIFRRWQPGMEDRKLGVFPPPFSLCAVRYEDKKTCLPLSPLSLWFKLVMSEPVGPVHPADCSHLHPGATPLCFCTFLIIFSPCFWIFAVSDRVKPKTKDF